MNLIRHMADASLPWVWLYAALFILQVGLQAYIWFRPTKPMITVLLVSEAACLIGGILLVHYFDSLSSGFMSYAAEMFFWVFAALGYAAVLFASGAICGTRYATCHPKFPQTAAGGDRNA